MLVLRLLNAPTPEQRPVWFVLDELASLQRLPQLHTAITENRKSKNPLILGFQGKAQLETIYGHLAEVMLSQPATKIFLKTTEPKAAEWVSKAIGTVEIERMRETHVHGTREGKSFSIDRQTEPLVMDSEIAGLPDKHAFLKLGNNVARFNFTYCSMAPIAADFEPRTVQDDELDFDPATLKPRRAQPQSVATSYSHRGRLCRRPGRRTRSRSRQGPSCCRTGYTAVRATNITSRSAVGHPSVPTTGTGPS